MKKTFFLLLTVASIANSQPKFSEISSMPGAFSRMGFGARGIGMGNAMSAIKEGALVSYYNPALAVFQTGNSFQTSYSFLSLDRNLNFVNFTRRFEIGRKEDSENVKSTKSTAGFSVGLINAGVSKIDARDGQGRKTGELSTSENQFFLSVSNKFSEKLALGIAFKFFYYKLYENVTTSGLGLDIGALYSFNESITISFMFSDINSKYEWDTGKIYGQDGNVSRNRFPLLKKIGAAYKLNEPKIIAALEFESSNAGTNFLRGGAEYNIYEIFFIRGGFDKLNLNNLDFSVRPSFGFSYFYDVNSIRIGVDYAFAVEPYSSGDLHIVGINVNF